MVHWGQWKVTHQFEKALNWVQEGHRTTQWYYPDPSFAFCPVLCFLLSVFSPGCGDRFILAIYKISSALLLSSHFYFPNPWLPLHKNHLCFYFSKFPPEPPKFQTILSQTTISTSKSRCCFFHDKLKGAELGWRGRISTTSLLVWVLCHHVSSFSSPEVWVTHPRPHPTDGDELPAAKFYLSFQIVSALWAA